MISRKKTFGNICSQKSRYNGKGAKDVERNDNLFSFEEACLAFKYSRKFGTDHENDETVWFLVRFDTVQANGVYSVEIPIAKSKTFAVRIKKPLKAVFMEVEGEGDSRRSKASGNGGTISREAAESLKYLFSIAP